MVLTPIFHPRGSRLPLVDDTLGLCATNIVWRLPLPGRALTVRNWTIKPVFLRRLVNCWSALADQTTTMPPARSFAYIFAKPSSE